MGEGREGFKGPSLVPDEINKDRGPQDKAPDEKIVPEEEVFGVDPKAKKESLQEPTQEKELSQEEIEKIVMEKVQDINENGTVTNVIGGYDEYRLGFGYLHPNNIHHSELEKLKSVLKGGLVGGGLWGNKHLIKEDQISFMYKDHLKTNVLPRARQLKKDYPNKKHSISWRGPYITIAKDGLPFEERGYRGLGLTDKIATIIDKDFVKEQCGVSSDKDFEKSDGVELKKRVPRRFIRGLILINPAPETSLSEEESKIALNHDRIVFSILELEYENWLASINSNESLSKDIRNRIKELEITRNKIRSDIQSSNPELYNKLLKFNQQPRISGSYWDSSIKDSGNIENQQNTTQEIVHIQQQIFRKETAMIPIYDQKGNLLWPKQMSYEEVKKFVAERDEKKSEGK